MRRCRNTAASLVVLLSIILSVVSCNKDLDFDFGFKDLCFYHPHTAPVKVNVDWNHFRHLEKPTGMTSYVWADNSDQKIARFVSHNLNYITLDLLEGYYHAFVFNQSESEYSTIEFHNLDDFYKAEARVIEVKSSWYSTKLPESKVGAEPEWLAIDCVQNIEVSEEMVAKAEAEYLATLPEAQRQQKYNEKNTKAPTKTQNEVGPLVPTSIIKNVDIFIHLENLPYLRSALGALEDMAEGCYISTRTPTENLVTHTIGSWEVIYHTTESGSVDMMKGALKATLSTFGLPAGHSGKPDDNNLYIKLLLVDNETILEHDFPIGDILADLNDYNGTQLDENGKPIWPEIHVYFPEPLPEVEPVGGGNGGFDVGVDGWGDDIVTILPLL
ncbi:MAG: DUF5119 domain-containing protein [Bacteroidales bacterium]|nr:DUF5119 domain-containing protein [Bacteroidales bacterium]